MPTKLTVQISYHRVFLFILASKNFCSKHVYFPSKPKVKFPPNMTTVMHTNKMQRYFHQSLNSYSISQKFKYKVFSETQGKLLAAKPCKV